MIIRLITIYYILFNLKSIPSSLLSFFVVIAPVFPVIFLLICFIHSFTIFDWSTFKRESGSHVIIRCSFYLTSIFHTPSTVLSLISFCISWLSFTSFFFPFPVPFCFCFIFFTCFFFHFLLFPLPFLALCYFNCFDFLISCFLLFPSLFLVLHCFIVFDCYYRFVFNLLFSFFLLVVLLDVCLLYSYFNNFLFLFWEFFLFFC